MNRRHLALPRVWMLTDERQGVALWDAAARLPRGAGVVVRHYSLPFVERAVMVRRLRRQGLFVALSGTDAEARRAGADAVYGRAAGALPLLYPVHNRREIAAAERARASLLLLSPVFPTRSHPGGRTLGPLRFGLLVRATQKPVIALGGMTAVQYRRLRGLGAQGWAAIDAWTSN
ncbi:thiamine phosphate synthase [Sphingomonas tabacisoli]|uniref:Thiamine phosphate synthase n=1 Tax=Sphingomonas tabacisoli TaxID=2249466 RepID=A0ABW4HZM8_9SPHN